MFISMAVFDVDCVGLIDAFDRFGSLRWCLELIDASMSLVI